MATPTRKEAVSRMNAGLMFDLLRRAAANADGRMGLPAETVADPERAAVLAFLVDQRWLSDDSDGTWTVTPSGRLWLESLSYGDVVKFLEYGGAVFLLSSRGNADETIVWHKGRFATIGVARAWHQEHFEVRRENEPITTSGGTHMETALAKACALLAEDLDVSQPPEPERLSLHMRNYLEGR